MSDILSRLRDAYTENPASALTLLPELFQSADEGKIVELPCKVGDTINRFKWDNGKFDIVSDVVTRIHMNLRGITVYTKSKFYPIKTKEYDFAPVKQYPNALADFYIGSREAAEAALKEREK